MISKDNPTLFNACFTLLFCLMPFCVPLSAQEFSGYVSGMPSLIVQQMSGNVQQQGGGDMQSSGGELWWQMLVHNRLNFRWQMTESLRADVGIRNRLITGSAAMLHPKSIGYDTGWANLSWNWAVVAQRQATATNGTEPAEVLNGASFVGNTSFDRLFLTFERDNWKVQAGRQRINWGQTFVWNPNDIFNTYSFFDFDYPERLGCDALRTICFHNATSSSEVAVSLNRNGKITAAALHRWNKNGFDIQIMAGEQAQTDYVVGGALTRDFNGVNLRSEASYFHPIRNATDTSGMVAISVGADYIFSNSLMLQAEVLYNNAGGASGEYGGSGDRYGGYSNGIGSFGEGISGSSGGLDGTGNESGSTGERLGGTGNESGSTGERLGGRGGLMELYAAPLSAKQMSVCTWSLFAGATYPITQRLSGSLSSVFFVNIQSVYAGLSLDYSVVPNLDFSFMGQYFSSYSMQIVLAFARLKYSF